MNADTRKLLEWLQEGCRLDDSRLVLQHIQKHLEEGKYKLPTDVENQIVHDFQSEDVVAAVKAVSEEPQSPTKP
jgi:hypothetical protein